MTVIAGSTCRRKKSQIKPSQVEERGQSRPALSCCVSDLTRQKTLECEAAEAVFKSDQPAPAQSTDYSSSVPMAGLPLAGAMMGLCLGEN